MPLLSPLTQDQQTHFLAVSLDDGALRTLAVDLGTTPKGYRVEKLSPWELADSVIDHYDRDPEVSTAVDAQLSATLGPSSLAEVLAAGGAAAITALLFDSPEPVRDLAWGLLHAAEPDAGERAAALAQSIIEDFDLAEQRAKEEKAATRVAGPDVQVQRAIRDASKQAQKALTGRERAQQRLDHLKQEAADLAERLTTARKELRESGRLHQQVVTERDRLQRERDKLHGKVQTGTAAEVERLRALLDDAERRERTLSAERDQHRDLANTLGTQLRALERREVAPPTPTIDPDAEPLPAPTAWSLPIFSSEFYDSIRGFERRILRATFDKIHRLCEDWRHPSLRAIPLEGLPDRFRIRIATDVRLIYRPLDGGRVEILSLIDREDLQRYVRNARG